MTIHFIEIFKHLSLGDIWVVLLFAYFLHLLLFYIVSPVHLSEIVPNDQHDRTREMSHGYRDSALTVAAVTFTGITFLLSKDTTSAATVSALRVLIFSIGLLVISYFMEILTEGRRIWVEWQLITVDYGVLSILIGLRLLAVDYMPKVESVSNVMILIAISIWAYGVKGMFEAYSGLLGDYDSRRSYFKEKIVILVKKRAGQMTKIIERFTDMKQSSIFQRLR